MAAKKQPAKPKGQPPAKPVENQRKIKGGVTGNGFKPGQSGNPGGRPAGRSVTAQLREMLDAEEVPGSVASDGRPIRVRVAAKIIENAILGDHRFVKELLDRTEGAPVSGDPLEGLDFNRLTDDEAHLFRALFAKLVGH